MLYILVAVLIAAADQAIKYWVVANIPLLSVKPFIPGVCHLTYLKNTGMAFSLLNQHTWILTVISCACILLLGGLIFMNSVPKSEKWPLALILGGATGNAIDRVMLGYVVDMFEPEIFEGTFLQQYNAVFNFADIFITCAGIAFIIIFIINEAKEEKKKKEEAAIGMKELERLKRNREKFSYVEFVTASGETAEDPTPELGEADGENGVEDLEKRD